MGHFLGWALAFPAVVYTVLLGVALVYWIFVMVGAAHVNLLGEGAGDAAADAMADAAADAALEGAAKGVLEGATKGMLEGAADQLEGGGDIGDADGADGGGHGTGIMASLKLRSAPATVVLSVLVFFSWVLSMIGARVAQALVPAGSLLLVAQLAILVLAPILALFPTSIAVRPLARVFTPLAAPKSADLVGKLCRIRTGTVTERFGEAVLEDGGAGLVVRVRVDSGEKLGRGDQAVIVGYDPERQEFTVAPMEGLLDEAEAPAKSARSRTR